MKDDFLWTKQILALGDSLTAWYGVQKTDNYPSELEKLLKKNGYDYEIINAGVSWDTSAQALSRVWDYSDQKMDFVILVIWWNDGLQNKSIEDMKDNINKTIDFYLTWWATIVLWWIEIPPFYGINYTRDFKQAYFDIAKDREWEIYFYESFLKDVWWVTQYNQDDKIHPTSEWYDIIVKNIFEYLEDKKIIEK